MSSYDLGELAHVALVSWSTIGLEFARLGVPVLTSTNGLAPFPHDDFLEWGATPAAYFDRLDGLLARPPSLDTIAGAFRWYNLYHLGTSLDLGDVVPRPYFNGLPRWKMPAEADAIEGVMLGRQDVLDVNHERLRAGVKDWATAGAAEADALRRHFRRVIRFLFTGRADVADFPLVWADGQPPPHPPGGASIGRIGDKILLSGWGRTWQRVSPLCRRLVPLCATAWASDPRNGYKIPSVYSER